MSETLPFHIKSNSPDELVFLLDSLISSPLCTHTKDWICYLYLHARSSVSAELNFTTWRSNYDRPSVLYKNSAKPVRLNLTELLSHILSLNKPSSRVFCVEQVRAWKLTTEQSTSPSLCYSINNDTQSLTFSHDLPQLDQHFNPAVWFALRGTYTLADFANDRSLTEYIEMHFNRLLSQSDQLYLEGYWQSDRSLDGRNWCLCPGHHLARTFRPLAGLFAPPYAPITSHEAELVMEEIMAHIDPRIIHFMKADLDRFEGMRHFVSGNHRDEWYKPISRWGRWKCLSIFMPLQAIADRLLEAFERVKNDQVIRSTVEAILAEECQLLASKIEAQRPSSLKKDNLVLGNNLSL